MKTQRGIERAAAQAQKMAEYHRSAALNATSARDAARHLQWADLAEDLVAHMVKYHPDQPTATKEEKDRSMAYALRKRLEWEGAFERIEK